MVYVCKVGMSLYMSRCYVYAQTRGVKKKHGTKCTQGLSQTVQAVSWTIAV
jgi:hypothetical protein